MARTLPTVLWAVLGLAGSGTPARVAAAPALPNPFLTGQYACGNQSLELEELADCGVTILSHDTWTEDLGSMRARVRRAHELGMRVLPYVSPEKAWDDFIAARSPENVGGAIPYYLAVSPKEHREWIIVRPDGLYQVRYGTIVDGPNGEKQYQWPEPGPGPGSWYMCANAKGYPEAVIAGCQAVLDMGFDGLFIDNAVVGRLSNVPCFGPQLGKHQHIYPDRDNTYAYPELIRRMAASARARDPGMIVFPNGGLEDAFKAIRTAGMLESYICAGGQGRWHSWERVEAWAKEYENERAEGRAVVALSYPDGKDHPVLDDTYYCYAAARWSDLVWGGGGSSTQLYRARLIVPTGPRAREGGIAYRAYDRGMVVVNPGLEPCSATLPLAPGLSDPVDLYAAVAVPVREGRFEVTLPRESGRVYVERAEAMRIYAEEARLEAWQARDALAARPTGPQWAVRDATHAAGQGEISLDTRRPHEGAFCLHVTSAGSGGEVHASQSVSFAGGLREPFEVGFWARTAGEAAAEVPVGIRFTDGTSTWWSPSPVRGADWTQQTAVYTPPKPVAALMVFLIATYAQQGDAWFDEVTLRVGDGTGDFGPNRLNDHDFEGEPQAREQWLRRQTALPHLDEAIAALRGEAPPAQRLAAALPALLACGDVSDQVGRAVALGSGIRVLFTPAGDRLVLGQETAARVTVLNGSGAAVTVGPPTLTGPAGFSGVLRQPTAAQQLAPGTAVTFAVALTQATPLDRPYALLTARVPCAVGAGGQATIPALATLFLEPTIGVELADETVAQAPDQPAALLARVVNNTGTAKAAVVTAALPEGFAPRLAEQAVTVPAHGQAEARLAVQVAPGLSRGRYGMTLRLCEPAAAGDQSLAYVPGAAGAPADPRPALATREGYAWLVPVVRCPRTAAAPTLDGRLDELCWQAAGRATGFVSLDLAEPAAAPTTGLVVYDATSLYIGIRCSKPLMANLKADAQRGAPNEGDVTSDDCVELYLDPGRTRDSYVRLVVNPSGAHKVTGQARWQWACAKDADGWVAEIAVELATLRVQPSTGAVWGMNIGRLDHLGTAAGVTQHSSWAAAYGTWHTPRTFGMLRFE
jgi:hypothetical protein